MINSAAVDFISDIRSQTTRSSIPPRKLVERCIRRYNFSMTLWRSSELALLLQQELNPPVMDIGCGDGTFAHLLGLEGGYGCDVSFAAVKKAQQGGCRYQSLWCANVEAIPAKDATFRTVIANCMLEHVSSLTSVLSEIYRILQPKGMVYITVPTPELHLNLMLAKAFSKVNLPCVARTYQGFFNKAIRHYHIKDRQEWTGVLNDHGFELLNSFHYLPPRTAWVFEIFLTFRLVTLIRAKFFKKEFFFPRRRLAAMAAPFLHACLNAEPGKGAGLMIKAQKR